MEIMCPHCGKQFDLGAEAAEHIRSQVRTKEMERELSSRMEAERARMAAEKERALEALQHEMALQTESARHERTETTALYEGKLKEARLQLEGLEAVKASELEAAKLSWEAKSAAEMATLRADLEAKSREVEYYKDMKARLSTKMVGESLEQHCEAEFNKIRMMAFPDAYFEKDNTVSASGSKGDYIFREEQDGMEVASIMFEMKNETDTQGRKHRNEDFFKELDKDRREKGCEYAVLVSLLEPESELYNAGIVDVSWKYPRMYVIRPQFFLPIITLIRNAGLSSLEARRELARAKQADLELSRFQDAFDREKEAVMDDLNRSWGKHHDAIAEIDKAIKRLEAAKAALESAGRYGGKAAARMEGMQVERLCGKGGCG